MKEYPKDKNFLITEDGRVFSKITEKWLTLRKKDDGYILVTLNGKVKRVHRLVCETYLPNPENKPEVNHKDGNKENNNLDNLEWVTSKENKEHAWCLGLYKEKGEKHFAAVYTDELISKACELMEDGFSNKDVSSLLGIDKDTVSHLRRGSKWKHITSNYNLKVKRVERKSVETVTKICQLLEKGESNESIESIFNSTVSTKEVQRIRRGDIFTKISSNFNIPKSKFSKLSEEEVLLIAKLLQEGWKISKIVNEHGFTRSSVSKIKRRQSWTHITCQFKW